MENQFSVQKSTAFVCKVILSVVILKGSAPIHAKVKKKSLGAI